MNGGREAGLRDQRETGRQGRLTQGAEARMGNLERGAAPPADLVLRRTTSSSATYFFCYLRIASLLASFAYLPLYFPFRFTVFDFSVTILQLVAIPLSFADTHSIPICLRSFVILGGACDDYRSDDRRSATSRSQPPVQ